MPHIHTKSGQHDHAADMFIFRTDFDEPKVILHMHRKIHSYMQFGGHIELDENPVQTMMHELKEETGYDVGQMKILQPTGSLKRLTGAMAHPIPASYNTHPVTESLVVEEHFHTSLGYALTTDQEPSGAVREGESPDIQLFTRAEVENIPADKILANVREITLYIFDTVLPNWEPVELSSFEA